jgi:putative aldouronate transport system permease protein
MAADMKTKTSRIVFNVLNYGLFILYAVACLFPILNLLAVSLSKTAFAEAGQVGLIPKGFNIQSYTYVFSNKDFFNALANSAVRVTLGPLLNVTMVMLASYPLARPKGYLKGRSAYAWFFIITMLFSGGMIPMYMLVRALKLNDTVLALILPGAVPVFSMVLMINFFRQVPEELYEAAVTDGASEMRIMLQIFMPLSLPSVITVTLFAVVAHWNAWFDGIIYNSAVAKYPLQSYLQTVVIGTSTNIDSIVDLNFVSKPSVDAARLFLAIIPMTVMYVSLQRFFVKGLTMGGVKG